MITELKLVYKVLNTSRGGRYKDSDSLSERRIRATLLEQRANLLLNFTSNGKKISQSITQDFVVVMKLVSGTQYEADLPPLMDLGKTRSLTLVHDYRNQMTVNHASVQQVSMFSAVNQYTRINTVRYNARTNKLITNIADTTGLKPNTTNSSDFDFYCTGVLYNPEDANAFGSSYDFETSKFPFPETLELPLVEGTKKAYDEFVIGQKEE